VSSLAERLLAVRERIARAARECGRDPESVRLVAISKFHPGAAIREAYAAGQRHFGENYAQELADKARELADLPALQWRFTGSLQRNKAKLLVEVGCVIETLSSAAHARFLHDKASALGTRCALLLQVNVLGEAQKGGIAPDELPALLSLVRELPSLEARGLMAIPPAHDPAAALRCYQTLAQLARAHQLPELSMGMSDDLELAVRAGATSVRVGTAIFGPRPR
jgi:pyridoxal phosphate enzyme (YggS family)